MPTPSTTISSTNIQTEFGGVNPIGLSEYYRGGSYVSSNVAGVASSGALAMSTLRNKSRVSISVSSTSVNEGDSVTFTITAPTLNTTVVYWASYSTTGTTSVDVVGDSPLGSFTISSNTATATITLKLDNATPETGEKFGIRLYYTQADRDAFTNHFADSGEVVTINNATYTVTPAANNVNEGGTLTVNVATTNITNGTTLYWTINHTTTVAGDFSANSGSFTITTNAGSFTIGPVSDQVTEGAESFTVSIRSYSTSGTVLATSSSITVNDTSTTPVPTYSATPAANSVNEGSSLTINVTTTNVANSTTLYWTISHTTTAAADFSTTSGSFTITNNAGSFTVSPIADNTTEGAETFTVQIRTGSTAGTVQATSSSITVNDTSQTPSYILNRTASSVNEGGSFLITFSTNQAGSFPYTITGVSSADIGGASLTGTISDGSILSYNVTADVTTEGTEIFTIALNNGLASTTVTINDTSITPPTFDLVSVTTSSASGTNVISAGDQYTVTVTANTTRSVATNINLTLNQVYFRGQTNTDWITGDVLYANLITIPANSTTGTFTGRLGPEQGTRSGLLTASAGTGAPTLTSRNVTISFQAIKQVTGVVVGIPSQTVVPTSSAVAGVIVDNVAWFTFSTGALSGTWTIDTNNSILINNSYTSPDTELAVYNNLGTQVAGITTLGSTPYYDDIGAGNYRSSLTFTLNSNANYWVRVSHYNGNPASSLWTQSETAPTTALSSMQEIRLSIASGSSYSSPASGVDTTPPTMTITRSGTGTVTGAITITFTSSESTSNFALADVGGTGSGNLSAFSGSGASYTATYTPPSNSSGTHTISVGGSTFTDAAGNGNTASNTLSLSYNTVSGGSYGGTTINITSIGSGGAGGTNTNSGSSGGSTTVTFQGTTLTAGGGGGGGYNNGVGGSGGSASGGDNNYTGGSGAGVSGDTGGGGGGGLNNSAPASSNSGGNGAAAAGLLTDLTNRFNTQYGTSTAGLGYGNTGSGTVDNNNGNPGTGWGAGGGGGNWYGGNGANGILGGGGGGAGGFSATNRTGGSGGGGVVCVVRVTSGSTVVNFYTTAQNITLPANTTNVSIYVVGAGGGGAGATNFDSTSGSGGGSGGVVAKSWA